MPHNLPASAASSSSCTAVPNDLLSVGRSAILWRAREHLLARPASANAGADADCDVSVGAGPSFPSALSVYHKAASFGGEHGEVISGFFSASSSVIAAPLASAAGRPVTGDALGEAVKSTAYAFSDGGEAPTSQPISSPLVGLLTGDRLTIYDNRGAVSGLANLRAGLQNKSDTIIGCRFCNPDRYIVYAGSPCFIKVYDRILHSIVEDYKPILSGSISAMSVSFEDLSPLVAVGTDVGEICIINRTSGEFTLLPRHLTSKVTCLEFSAHSKSMLVSGCADGRVACWSVADLARPPMCVFDAHSQSVTAVLPSPITRLALLSCGRDGKIVLYDTESAKVVRVVSENYELSCVAYHSDGRTVAVGTASGEILVFDLRRLSLPVAVLQAHVPYRVVSLSFFNPPPQSLQHGAASTHRQSQAASGSGALSTPSAASSRYPPSVVSLRIESESRAARRTPSKFGSASRPITPMRLQIPVPMSTPNGRITQNYNGVHKNEQVNLSIAGLMQQSPAPDAYAASPSRLSFNATAASNIKVQTPQSQHREYEVPILPGDPMRQPLSHQFPQGSMRRVSVLRQDLFHHNFSPLKNEPVATRPHSAFEQMGGLFMQTGAHENNFPPDTSRSATSDDHERIKSIDRDSEKNRSMSSRCASRAHSPRSATTYSHLDDFGTNTRAENSNSAASYSKFVTGTHNFEGKNTADSSVMSGSEKSSVLTNASIQSIDSEYQVIEQKPQNQRDPPPPITRNQINSSGNIPPGSEKAETNLEQQKLHLTIATVPNFVESSKDVATNANNLSSISGSYSGAAGDAKAFSTMVIENAVEDALQDFREIIRTDIQNLHIDVLRQFENQRNEIEVIVNKFSSVGQILEENRSLREEVQRLRSNFR